MTTQSNNLSPAYLLTDTQAEMQSPEEAGFSLIDFLRIIRVRCKIILGTAVTIVALATIIVLQLTPLYSATAVVVLDQRKNNVEDTGAVLSELPSDPSTILNQVQILTSLKLAGRVVDKLKLDQDPEFNPKLSGIGTLLSYLNPFNWLPADPKTQADAQGKDLERSVLIHNFLRKLSVAPIGLSTAIEVTFQSEDPAKSAKIANAIADAYVEDQLDAKFEATQKATQWLSGRISELSHQAQTADTAVQQYKAEHNITTTANGVSVVEQQTSDINSQLILAKTDLAEKQANYGRLAALARIGQATSAPQVVASTLVAALRTQETEMTRQIADLSSKYGTRHPKMLDLQAQKANLDAKIAEEVQRVVDSVKNDVEAAQVRVASLENSLKDVETRGAGQNQDQVKLTALQSAATSARAMYEAFLGRLNQTQGRQGIQTPDARIISDAEIPQYASSPKKALTIGAAIPAGLLLGLMLAFIAERLDAGFRTAPQLENLLGIPVLSTIPEVIGPDKTPVNVIDLIVDKPMSSYAEAVRGLHLGVALSNLDKPPKVILVTSSVPGEGKTTIALSLARMAARSGMKTVIVDGDLRRPSLAKTIGNVEYEHGLIEALMEKRPVEQYLGDDLRSTAKVLPCLQTPASPADVLGAQSMQALIEGLREHFDLVIVDSAPILPVNDTRILCRVADAVLFVVRWETTPREAAVNAIRSLKDVHAPVVGVAMARADNERFRYYSYGYQNYRNYTKYYSD